MGLGCGRTSVLRRVIGWRGQRGHELVEVQGLVEDSAMGRHTGRAGGMRPLWKELENRDSELIWDTLCGLCLIKLISISFNDL